MFVYLFLQFAHGFGVFGADFVDRMLAVKESIDSTLRLQGDRIVHDQDRELLQSANQSVQQAESDQLLHIDGRLVFELVHNVPDSDSVPNGGVDLEHSAERGR